MKRTVYYRKRIVTESVTEYQLVDKFGKRLSNYELTIESLRKICTEKGWVLKGNID